VLEKRIKIVETKTYSYLPDLNEDWYQENGVTSIEDALKVDQKDYENGAISLDELGAGLSETTQTSWTIVEEG